MKIIQSPSPNFSNSDIELVGVTLHKTLGLMPWTLDWLQNPKSYSSAHVLFCRNGDIHEMVAHNKRAWGAGRVKNPSERGKKMLDKHPKLKPGHFLLQAEYECLLNQTFTSAQYKSSVWYYRNKLKFKLTEENLLTHQDTCDYKSDLEKERKQILKRIKLRDAIKNLLLQLKILLMQYIKRLNKSRKLSD